MLDLTATTFSLIAIAMYLIALSFLIVVMQRTRNRFRRSLIYLSISVFILLITRILGLLNLYSIFNGEDLRDGLVALASILAVVFVYTLFKEIRGLTDVELHHTKETRRENSFPPPKRSSYENFERQEPRDGKRRLRAVNGYVDFTNE